MQTINILGAGISGLSAAHYLTKMAPDLKIRILEGTKRVGGWIKSRKLENGIIFQQSARTIRPTGEAGLNTLELISDLNLLNQVIPIKRTHPAAKNRMIYANGKLHTLPNSLGDLFMIKEPFKKPLLAYLAKDMFARSVPKKDEPIYDFVKRRFGDDVADYLISPLICGICAGNAKEISVNFLMEGLFKKEQQYGSISKGMIYDILKKPFGTKKNINPLEKMVQDEKWSVYTFPEGLGTISDKLERDLEDKGVRIDLGVRCKELKFDIVNQSVEVLLDDYSASNCDHLISSISAGNLSYLVEKQHPNLAKLLRKIPMVTVGVVNLHYRKKLPLQDAFGFLVPPSENLPILGVIFDSSCSNDKENTVLTVMVGGNWFEKYFGVYNDPQELETEIMETTTKHLKKILNITETPDNYQVNVLKDCIPQYLVGHKENLEKIESYIKDFDLPLSLCGFSYYGVGINDAILSARKAVRNLLSETKP